MRESAEQLDPTESKKWNKKNNIQANVISIYAADTKARHGGIEFAITSVAEQLKHLDGTINTETEININHFIRIISQIVNEERIHRHEPKRRPIPEEFKKRLKLKRLKLRLGPSEIDNDSVDNGYVKEAAKLMKIYGFTLSILHIKKKIIKQLDHNSIHLRKLENQPNTMSDRLKQLIKKLHGDKYYIELQTTIRTVKEQTQNKNWVLLKEMGLILAALIRKGERRDRHDPNKK